MANQPNQGWGTPVSGLESLGGMVGNAVESYERTLNLVQSWFEGILATYKEQAESYGAMLRSVDASLHALEEVVEGQAKITKALGESLDASRQVVTAATNSNQHSTERIETFVGDVLASAHRPAGGAEEPGRHRPDHVGRPRVDAERHVPQDDPGLERCLWSNAERNPPVQAGCPRRLTGDGPSSSSHEQGFDESG